MSLFVYTQPCDFIAFFFQMLHGIFYSRMFNGCGVEVFAVSRIAFRCAVDGPVIPFCAAAGEEDFFFLSTDTVGKDFRRFADFLFHFQTHNADGSRVPKVFTQHIDHFFRHFGQRSCGGGIIEINHFCFLLSPIHITTRQRWSCPPFPSVRFVCLVSPAECLLPVPVGFPPAQNRLPAQ